MMRRRRLQAPIAKQFSLHSVVPLFKWGAVLVTVTLILIALRLSWILIPAYLNRGFLGFEVYRMLIIEHVADQEHVNLLVYDPQKSRADIYTIPNSVKIEAIGDYGKYSLSGIYTLSHQEGFGSELVKFSLARTLGLLVQDAIEIRIQAGEYRPENVISRVRSRLWQQSFAGEKNPVDALRLRHRLGALADNEIHHYDLETMKVLDKVTEPDGQEFYVLNELRWDDWWERTYPPTNPEAAKVQVIVENTTSTPGLAKAWGRVMKHEGFDLVGVEDSQSSLPVTELVFQDRSLLKHRVGQMLIRNFKALRVRVDTLPQYRSDVVLRLARDEGLGENGLQFMHPLRLE